MAEETANGIMNNTALHLILLKSGDDYFAKMKKEKDEMYSRECRKYISQDSC